MKNKKSSYHSKIKKFMKIYNVTSEDLLSNEKIEFRYFCFRYLKYMRNIPLYNIQLNNKYESVLIEFRLFPHIEFLIRNMINKLDKNWSHTIICGNLNHNFILNIVKKIGKNIKVIKINFDNLTQNEYSNMLTTIDFWNLLFGEKILIYQEDSCIFKSNINDFLKFDYIGAPWLKSQKINSKNVGNGGFSLRTKKCMIDVINKIPHNIFVLESPIKDNIYLHNEDVYFTTNMIKYNIGKVADYNTAKLFSSETIHENNSLGGHNFWLSDKNWKLRLYQLISID